MTLSAATTRKALRLYAQGKVQEIATPRVFIVEGDHGTYAVVIAGGEISCTCKATGACAHIAAAGLAIKA